MGSSNTEMPLKEALFSVAKGVYFHQIFFFYKLIPLFQPFFFYSEWSEEYIEFTMVCVCVFSIQCQNIALIRLQGWFWRKNRIFLMNYIEVKSKKFLTVFKKVVTKTQKFLCKTSYQEKKLILLYLLL